MNPEVKHDMLTQGPASIPAFAAVMSWLFGVPLEKWVALAGLVFLILQSAFLLWKWRRDHRREIERIRAGEPPPPTTDKAAL
jgi:hypothetical protein